MTATSSFGSPLENGAAASAVVPAAGTNARPEAAGPTDSSGRRIAVEPPAWDLMPPTETETIRRFRPS